ncbi:hypothetical protein HH212_18080 [Massilia forsythiae]|uniref:Uncharacterized protein n=1 Tax=Massilia forsythiae TaxID=2728020 RepID=A0A7Z2VYR1_9BURK|nr:hypothetical protein [Massilia forsythiae]QJE01699.1 hypothetical protein HH212_18080 [Massilia forsythiae]
MTDTDFHSDSDADGVDIPGLHEACLELAHVVLAAGQPQVSRDILETLAAKFAREAADFAPLVAGHGRDTGLLARAVHYLNDAHALPLMGTDMDWFRQSLACLVELAVPDIALSGKGAAFLGDLALGIEQARQDHE